MAARRTSPIASLRLSSQQIIGSRCKSPLEVVETLGAIQAQDYPSALWAVGLRLPGATQADVEEAVSARRIVRTWPMRGTLHFVPAADIRWMLTLLTPRVIAGMATRARQLELDDKVFARARKAFAKALQGDRQLSREDILAVLEQGKIASGGQRGYHILARLAQEGFLCFAGRMGKQQSFALLDEWVPKSRELDREASITELARRYFSGHGPATLKDFVWWSGLKVSDARAGIENASAHLTQEVIDGSTCWLASDHPSGPAHPPRVHLLPGFDEYLLGYQDRSAVLAAEHAPLIVPGNNGMFLSIIVTQGRVTGTWKTSAKAKATLVSPVSFQPLKKTAARALADAAKRYGKFLGTPVMVSDTKSPDLPLPSPQPAHPAAGK